MYFLMPSNFDEKMPCIMRAIPWEFWDEVFSLKIWGQFIQQCICGGQVWYEGIVKATVFGVLEDLTFKISEGSDQNWSCPESVLLAVSVKLKVITPETVAFTIPWYLEVWQILNQLIYIVLRIPWTSTTQDLFTMTLI